MKKMAGKEVAKASMSTWQIATFLIAGLLVLGIVGHFMLPNEVEVEVEKEVLVDAPINDSEWVPIADHDALVAERDGLLDEFADEIRENEVKELARDAIEEDYIEDLDFDEEEFDDSHFELAYAAWTFDEDEGDYEVTVDFVIFEYNEDDEMINTYAANATMEVQDDDDVKSVEIVFV